MLIHVQNCISTHLAFNIINSDALISDSPKNRPHRPPIDTFQMKKKLFRHVIQLLDHDNRLLIKSKLLLATVRLCLCFGRSIIEIVTKLPASSRNLL